MIPSLEGWVTKVKVAPPHEVRLAPLEPTQYSNILGIFYSKKEEINQREGAPLKNLFSLAVLKLDVRDSFL